MGPIAPASLGIKPEQLNKALDRAFAEPGPESGLQGKYWIVEGKCSVCGKSLSQYYKSFPDRETVAWRNCQVCEACSARERNWDLKLYKLHVKNDREYNSELAVYTERWTVECSCGYCDQIHYLHFDEKPPVENIQEIIRTYCETCSEAQ